jgi:hypothetical protein
MEIAADTPCARAKRLILRRASILTASERCRIRNKSPKSQQSGAGYRQIARSDLTHMTLYHLLP